MARLRDSKILVMPLSIREFMPPVWLLLNLRRCALFSMGIAADERSAAFSLALQQHKLHVACLRLNGSPTLLKGMPDSVWA